ncbi:putative hydrolase, alpha/beta hydrolase family [Nocardia nova SH22a]|uniref:Putative hydrolase, alpha/beta hydrolase family n=1 Tax=Nocardia nova SH22a TaxID=1415166 RepID=W5TR19_9NOCA|nr:alpha/beta hydrolase [Nocardia nova]AHH21363.1 putative hydrolase, alpha/beta hydrolase family [Nocardia nova SH22a]
MQTVTSQDGTTIAYDRIGSGEAGTVVLIGGAFGYREVPNTVELAEALAGEYGLRVINYDRRGRGDSTDSPGVYDSANEIADLRALIEAEGGSAALAGWGSGAVLALLAARSGAIPGLTDVVAFEPPIVVDPKDHIPPRDAEEKLRSRIAEGKRGGAVWYYLTKIMGVPMAVAGAMRMSSVWKKLVATADSTAHDFAVLKPFSRGETQRAEDWAALDVPVLLLIGDRSSPALTKGAERIAEILPDATLRRLPGVSNDPVAAQLAPAIGEFLTRTR